MGWDGMGWDGMGWDGMTCNILLAGHQIPLGARHRDVRGVHATGELDEHTCQVNAPPEDVRRAYIRREGCRHGRAEALLAAMAGVL